MRNEVSRNEVALTALQFIAHRPKFYSAFAKFGYQFREVLRFREWLEVSTETFDVVLFVAMMRKLLASAMQQEIWKTTEWEPIEWLLSELSASGERIEQSTTNNNLDYPALLAEVGECWRKLDNLSRMCEELCRDTKNPPAISPVGE